MSALATVTGRVLTAHLLQNFFPDWVFYVTIADADIGSLKSLPSLFDTYLYHMLVKFEQNRMVRTTQNFALFWQKRVNHFWQSIDAILENVSVAETIVWC